MTEKELLRAGFDLRAAVCKEMVDRKDGIAPFITGIFDAYVEAMSLEGCWGGEESSLRTIKTAWQELNPAVLFLRRHVCRLCRSHVPEGLLGW